MKVKNVIIKNRVNEPVKNGFYIEITFMFGDADGYQTEEMGPFSNEELPLLCDALDTINRCMIAYPNGRGGGDTYNHVDGFEKWFDTDNEDAPKQAIDMVYTPDGWGDQAEFEYYHVFYYDNGQKYDCEIICE